MTLKYESEILFDLMKRDGDVTPSDVLPYESELKEKYLYQVEGAYPKLQDYRPEWLNYNLNAHIPADFPVESVSNVTNASFENVVPYAYRSAILKGNTLLVDELGNECEIPNSPKITLGAWINTNTGVETASVSSFNTGFLKCPTVPFIVKGNNRYKRIVFYDQNKTFISGIDTEVANNSDVTFDSTKIPSNAFYLRISASITTDGVSYTPDTKLLIEDVSGNNLYITHLESVKMPVLTTSNEDGTKTIILSISEDLELRGIGDVKDELDLVSGKLTQRIGEIVLDGSEHWLIYGGHFYTTNSIANHSPKCMGSWLNGVSNMTQIGVMCDKGVIRINLNNINDDIQVLKNTLSQNPLTLHYELKTPTIKTVDLSCINEQGESATFRPIEGTMHVSTSSQTLPPLLDISVPVEATTQNLMSFANIVEEE